MSKSLGILIKHCLGQSSQRKTNSIPLGLNKGMTFSFTMLLFLWLLVSLVLISSFTSLLLNTYFNVKTTPIVKSLEDIREHKELLVSGIPRYLKKVINDYEINIGDLLERINEDKDNFPSTIPSYKIAEKVINSRSVFIGSTHQRNVFLLLNKYYHDKFIVAKKYYQQIMLFYVNKRLPFSNKIQY